jgi:hypothetical protein
MVGRLRALISQQSNGVTDLGGGVARDALAAAVILPLSLESAVGFQANGDTSTRPEKRSVVVASSLLSPLFAAGASGELSGSLDTPVELGVDSTGGGNASRCQ